MRSAESLLLPDCESLTKEEAGAWVLAWLEWVCPTLAYRSVAFPTSRYGIAASLPPGRLAGVLALAEASDLYTMVDTDDCVPRHRVVVLLFALRQLLELAAVPLFARRKTYDLVVDAWAPSMSADSPLLMQDLSIPE